MSDADPEKEDLEEDSESEKEEEEEEEEEEEDLLGDELNSLISFANLENVVKHIIAKFKMMESHTESTDAEIRQIRMDLESCATLASISELHSELTEKIAQVNKLVATHKESAIGLENQIERNKVLCTTIDKKLETTIKEKAVQDRLIRETQDAMQDKVSVMELNMFEAKFAGYTTKLEHQEVINMLRDYASVDAVERLSENVKALRKQFDAYTRTAQLLHQLQELRDWVSSELLHYAKAVATQEKIDDLQGQLREQHLAMERANSALDDKLRGLSDRMTSIYIELNDDINQRALASTVQELQHDLRRYALRGELEAFQQDCMPKLKFCVDSIKAFGERLRAQDGAIARVDEVLLDKASKYDLVVANTRIDQCYPRDKGMEEFQRLSEGVLSMSAQLADYIANETERFEKLKPPDYGPIFKDINSRIALKADKADLVEIYQLKADRADSDDLAKLQETIHRQLEYLAVTAFGLSKLVLTEVKASDSKTLRAQQKAQVLMQSEAIWHWILHNEPPPNLDSFRPPKGLHGDGDGKSPNVRSDTQLEKEKRVLEERRRRQLEKKLDLEVGGG